MPLGSSRNVLSQASLLRPYRAMSSQLSAQAITAHTAITRMSRKRCSTLPPQRGSSIVLKYCARFSIDTSCSLAVARKRHPTSAPGRREKFHASPLPREGKLENPTFHGSQRRHFKQNARIVKSGHFAQLRGCNSSTHRRTSWLVWCGGRWERVAASRWRHRPRQ